VKFSGVDSGVPIVGAPGILAVIEKDVYVAKLPRIRPKNNSAMRRRVSEMANKVI
jgi:hypothetical protein